MSIISAEEVKEIFTLLEDYSFEELDCDNFEKRFEKLYDEDFFLAEGTTKGVIIPRGKNYVIKIPFYGKYYRDYYHPEEIEFNEFYSDISQSHDYCAAEVIIYNRAKNEGLEACFAETCCIGKVNERPIYVQQKASIGLIDWDIFCEECGGEEEAESRCNTLSDKYSITNEDEGKLDPTWINDFISAYDEDFFEVLSDFLLENEIYDLHDENVGYISGMPVLVDYSSFNG